MGRGPFGAPAQKGVEVLKTETGKQGIARLQRDSADRLQLEPHAPDSILSASALNRETANQPLSPSPNLPMEGSQRSASSEPSKAHLTAISRKKPSVPMRWLADHRLLRGRCLDYGCGRGFDATWFNFQALYDPYYAPDRPKGRFDTVTCHFVLNVIPSRFERLRVLKDIQSYLAENGIAYITIRRDVEREGWTSRGTYQENVRLDLPILYENSKFAIYKLTRRSTV